MTGGSPTLVQLVNPAPEVDSCSLVLTLVIPIIQENWKMRVHSGSDSIWGKYHLSSRDSSVSPNLRKDLLNLPEGWRAARDTAILLKRGRR